MTRQDWFGIVLLGVSAVIVLGVLVLRTRGEGGTKVPEAGAERACVTLLDVTDPLTPDQQAALRVRLRELVQERLEAGEELTVWALGAFAEGRLKRIFEETFPGCRANPWVSNPRQIAARCDSTFQRPLLEAVTEAAAGEGSSTSPILASVTEIANELRSSGARHLTLIVVSDLVERTSSLAFDEAVPAFSPEEHGSGESRGHIAVEVWLVTRARDRHVDTSALCRFWQAYFRTLGASSVTIVRL